MIKYLIKNLKVTYPRVEHTPIQMAKLHLFYLMLGANVLKGLIYLSDAILIHHGDGSWRAIRLMISSVLIMMVLKRFPGIIKWGIHYAVLATILHIYYRVFNASVGSDVVACQAIYMVVISAFYGLNKWWGSIYTVVASAAVILCHYIGFRWTGLHPLPEGLNDLYIIINFLVILLAHFYFHGELYSTLREKDILNAELAEAALAKGNFLSMMSHELRTPLNSVIGIASLLADDHTNSRQKEQLEGLKFSAEGLLSLINNILDVNKLESGKFELEEVPFKLGTLLKGITNGMKPVAEGKSLAISLHIDEEITNKELLGDPTRLGQVLYNLVGNAIKFTKKGKVTINAVLVRKAGDLFTIKFEVADTGIGISDSQREKIFDPFIQASQNTTRKYGGTGLGLSIVKQLVTMFGSEIKIESTLGEGTRFYFEIEMKCAPLQLRQDDAAVDDEALLSELSILAAEDNAMNIFFMRQLFKKWGIHADIVENGQEVMEFLSHSNYDVILMDMHMPVMDGIEATKAIRLLTDPIKANIHIIALTGSVSDNGKARALESGMNDYLSKPFQLDDLKSKLLARASL